MSKCNSIVIEPLLARHNRADFDCGHTALNTYIKRQAGQDIKRRISRVFVATSLASPTEILGFYTLSSLSIELNQLPVSLIKRLPRHPIPAALLGRLAVQTSARGNGIGKLLLVNAIKRTLAVGNELAIYALVVDAIDEKARAFYEQYGFVAVGHVAGRLWLPLRCLAFMP